MDNPSALAGTGNLSKTERFAKLTQTICRNLPFHQKLIVSIALCELEKSMENQPLRLEKEYGTYFKERMEEELGN